MVSDGGVMSGSGGSGGSVESDSVAAVSMSGDFKISKMVGYE